MKTYCRILNNLDIECCGFSYYFLVLRRGNGATKSVVRDRRTLRKLGQNKTAIALFQNNGVLKFFDPWIPKLTD